MAKELSSIGHRRTRTSIVEVKKLNNLPGLEHMNMVLRIYVSAPTRVLHVSGGQGNNAMGCLTLALPTSKAARRYP